MDNAFKLGITNSAEVIVQVLAPLPQPACRALHRVTCMQAAEVVFDFAAAKMELVLALKP